MFCHKCGEQLLEKSRFCSNCGEKVLTTEERVEQTLDTKEISLGSELHTSEKSRLDQELSRTITENQTTAVAEIAATTEAFEPEEDEGQTIQQTDVPRGRFLKKLPILIPVVSLLLAGGGVSASYFNETNKNEKVLALQQSAETAALNGEYTKAEKALQSALHMRPAYAVLQQDMEAVHRASSNMAELTAISEKIKEQNFVEAEDILSSLKETIESEVDPLFEPFTELIEAKEVTITVGKIKQELSELTTVNQLINKLTLVARLPSEEAAAVKEQILTKIVQISSDHAEQQLQKKQFSDAIATINQGLEYATDNKTLLSFKEKIEQEQAAFEEAEQTRLEQAIEAAAREDLQNYTAAVEITSFEYEVDEYGDLYLYGEVTNVATKDISSVTIDYTIYDLEGNSLDDRSTTVYPYYVNRGEQGSFEDVVFYLSQDVNVEVDNITWFVE
ncbi:zinc-ribbon domain-containing protein [Alkalihalobacillus deserti]|uniref:zinc-ribbon domain-containing protein n=1 Tax=Alkalihalobacillus deserti TaxID=2879466 RepID=UPI001D14C64A|nr:zinc-ribbon domain-containing protein [Alkalihalobacillus deserti]